MRKTDMKERHAGIRRAIYITKALVEKTAVRKSWHPALPARRHFATRLRCRMKLSSPRKSPYELFVLFTLWYNLDIHIATHQAAP